jgi:hypothetical protein
VSSARRRQYSNWKDFSDVLGPLRRYLRKQVGRPWDKIWCEITQTLDSRSLTGQHIFDHISWEVEQHAWVGNDGRVYRNRQWGSVEPVSGLYIHPMTRLLRHAPKVDSAFAAGHFSMRKPRSERSVWPQQLPPTSDAIALMACAYGSTATAAGSFTYTDVCPSN